MFIGAFMAGPLKLYYKQKKIIFLIIELFFNVMIYDIIKHLKIQSNC